MRRRQAGPVGSPSARVARLAVAWDPLTSQPRPRRSLMLGPRLSGSSPSPRGSQQPARNRRHPLHPPRGHLITSEWTPSVPPSTTCDPVSVHVGLQFRRISFGAVWCAAALGGVLRRRWVFGVGRGASPGHRQRVCGCAGRNLQLLAGGIAHRRLRPPCTRSLACPALSDSHRR
jgi:hypothetical protein